MLAAIADIISRSVTPDMIAATYPRLPVGLANAVAMDRFRRTVRHAARHSKFYRDAFAKHGIDPNRVRTAADLGDLYTTPDDVSRCPEDFLCGKPAIVFESSGTSGRNKRVYYGQDELEHMGKMFAGGFRIMGIVPSDRVANAFDFSIWIPGLACHYGLMAAGVFTQAFGKVDPMEVYKRLKSERHNVLLGEPTWLIRLTEIAERQGSVPLKLVVGGAEEMPRGAAAWISKVWQGAKVKMCYGSVEMGGSIGFQPCDKDGYHLNNLDLLPEIVDADAEGYGEVVLTTLSRHVMPLIRYRTRDVARLDQCTCGIAAPHIGRLRGRRDEIVVASGGNLYPQMFEKIFASIEGMTFDWQVVFRLDGLREVVEIHVETASRTEADLDAEIRRAVGELYPDLMKNLALGTFALRTIVHPPESVRLGRKLKRLVDLRHAPLAAERDAVAWNVTPSLEGAHFSLTLLILGDSVTLGAASLGLGGVSEYVTPAYPALVEAKLVQEKAVNCELRIDAAALRTTRAAQERCRELFEAHRPSLLLLATGSNDADVDWRRLIVSRGRVVRTTTPLPAYEAALSAILEAAAQIGCQARVFEPLAMDLERRAAWLGRELGRDLAPVIEASGGADRAREIVVEYRSATRRIAGEENIIPCGTLLEKAGTADVLGEDGVHPNAEGHRLIAQATLASLSDAIGVLSGDRS